MQSGVSLYGGFAGSETARDQRDSSAHPTIIDGETVRRCVVGANGATLDGFIMTRGHGDSGGGMYNHSVSPTVRNCTFTQNSADSDGGGMCNNGGYAVVINCAFTQNSAGGWHASGGGMYNYNSYPTVMNCTFTQNLAAGYNGGAGMYNDSSSPTVINCTFTQNSTEGIISGNGGGMYNDNSSPSVTNCILWGDVGAPEVHNESSLLTVTFSCVEGGYVGAGNINVAPLFVDAPICYGCPPDLQLQPGSPCIDTGTATGAPATDIQGTPRPQGAGFDMGAYER